MNTRYTLIMLLLAIALGTFAYLQRDLEPVDYTDGGPTPTAAALFELAAEDIQEIKVEHPDGDYTITRAADGWEIGEQRLAEYANSTIEILAKPEVLRTLEADRNPADYGFDSPTMTVTLTTASGESRTLIVGDKNPIEAQYYVRLSETDPISIVGSSYLESLATWAAAPPYAPTPTPEGGEDAPSLDELDAGGEGEDGAGESEDGASEDATPEASDEGSGDDDASDATDSGATEDASDG
jgi:hypothetical protein